MEIPTSSCTHIYSEIIPAKAIHSSSQNTNDIKMRLTYKTTWKQRFSSASTNTDKPVICQNTACSNLEAKTKHETMVNMF
jgi:hypothetical protein